VSNLLKNTGENSETGCFSEKILLLCLFLFLALSVSFHGSYKVSGIIILCSYSLFLFSTVRKKIQLSKLHITFAASIIIYIMTLSMEIIIHKESIRELDPISKVILYAPFLILLSTLKPKILAIPWGFALGSVVLFLVAFYEREALGLPRAGAGINPIQFGNIACAMGLICFFLVNSQNNKKIIMLLIIGGLAGITASFLSLSRGGWLIIPIAILLLIIQHRHNIIRNPKRALISIIIAFSSLSFLLIQTNIPSRINTINHDLEKMADGNNSTSTGDRIAMWKVAFNIFTDNPIIGTGKSDYLLTQQQKIDNNLVPSRLKDYNQAHNAYLDAGARRGIIGIAGLVIFLLAPALIALKHIRHKQVSIRTYAYCLFILSLSFSSFNLTQSMFNHNSGIIMFSMFFIILLSGLNTEKNANDLSNYHH